MRAVVQRVKRANVKINDKIVEEINNGLLVLLAVHERDVKSVISKMSDKIISLRIFNDPNGKMNVSVKDVRGEILVVSQFTLYGDCKKGNRPSFIESAEPKKALLFYKEFVEYIRANNIKVATGEFGAKMEVSLTNDGPVTIIIDL